MERRKASIGNSIQNEENQDIAHEVYMNSIKRALSIIMFKGYAINIIIACFVASLTFMNS